MRSVSALVPLTRPSDDGGSLTELVRQIDGQAAITTDSTEPVQHELETVGDLL